MFHRDFEDRTSDTIDKDRLPNHQLDLETMIQLNLLLGRRSVSSFAKVLI
jgi:hypothetical protein